MNSEQPTFTVAPMAVGRYRDAAGVRRALAHSALETERSTRAMSRILGTFHFRAGENLMVTALIDESVQALGMERSIMQYNMVAVSADSSLYDAKRVESIIRRFKLVGAFGITQATLEGLRGLGHDPEQLFKDMVAWAWPGAYESLLGKPGLNVYRCLELGPAIAVECSVGEGAHIDRFEWHVEERDGEVILSSRLERCEVFQHYRTGIKGKVIHGVCRCGNPDPRIVPI